MVFSSVNLLKNSLAETHQRNRVSGPYVKIYTTSLSLMKICGGFDSY